MTYSFAELSPADFEDLVRDLIGQDLGISFEAFAAGPDGGVDGRHAKGKRKTIIQAKHYVGSSYSALKTTMRRERVSIKRLSPSRYLLATSRPLSPANKSELKSIIGRSLRSEKDILSPRDLNALLRKYPEIEKAHIKLWLTGAAVLERLIRSAADAFNNITRKEIEAKLRVYAPNPSFDGAHAILESHRVVIISGPPGVGKTTLAEMLSYAYVAEGWELVAIRSLDDGFASINDTKRQVFYFDDFLGKIALDRQALAHKDSDLSRFIRRTHSSQNARFILTTRAYIFEEARRVSEHLADDRLDVSKYVLDVSLYTRRIKARILYNHLLIAETPQEHIDSLIESGQIPAIIDHKNYNPRIIEWMTDVARIGRLKPDAYPTAFVDGLDHPAKLWDTAFRTHISKVCQHLLFALFFSSEYGIKIERLRTAYDGIHPRLCAKYGEPYDPKDFEEALRILENGFIVISGVTVDFINPSLRDYLVEYIDNVGLLREFAASARQIDWAQNVWIHAQQLSLNGPTLKSVARAFFGITKEFRRAPIYSDQGGLGYISRIGLLLEWWESSGEPRYANLALALARKPVGELQPWSDGEEAIALIRKLRDGKFDRLPCATGIAEAIEVAVSRMIRRGLSSDELKAISDSAYTWHDYLGEELMGSIEEAIKFEFEDIERIISEIDSDSTLTDHIELLQEFARRTSVPSQSLNKAIKAVRERIAELEERTPEAKSPAISSVSPDDNDRFDDVALKNLFASLSERRGPRSAASAAAGARESTPHIKAKTAPRANIGGPQHLKRR